MLQADTPRACGVKAFGVDFQNGRVIFTQVSFRDDLAVVSWSTMDVAELHGPFTGNAPGRGA